jgi:hypothetical protein
LAIRTPVGLVVIFCAGCALISLLGVGTFAVGRWLSGGVSLAICAGGVIAIHRARRYFQKVEWARFL